MHLVPHPDSAIQLISRTSRKPEPLQPFQTVATQPFCLGVTLHKPLHEPQIFLDAAGEGPEKKVVDGLSRRRGDIPILRAERRTRVHCASPDLDARRKGEGTIFRAGRGSISTVIWRSDRRPQDFFVPLRLPQASKSPKGEVKNTLSPALSHARRRVKKMGRWYVRDASVSHSTEPAIPAGCTLA
jgi:hypothetical protein